MKQGRGQLTQQNGSVYQGIWDANIIVGTGKVTIQVGDKNKRDGLPKEVRSILCFRLFNILVLNHLTQYFVPSLCTIFHR